jgi:hypothetical protein
MMMTVEAKSCIASPDDVVLPADEMGGIFGGLGHRKP